MKKTILYILLAGLMSACSNKFSIQKRHYNKGFYFASHAHKPSKLNKHGKVLRMENSQLSQGILVSDNNILTKAIEPKLDDILAIKKEAVLNLFTKANYNQFSEGKDGYYSQRSESLKSNSTLDNKAMFLQQEARGTQSANTVQKRTKRDLGDVVTNVYVGYLCVLAIGLIIVGIQTIGLLATLGFVLVAVLTLLVLYGIGSLFTGL